MSEMKSEDWREILKKLGEESAWKKHTFILSSLDRPKIETGQMRESWKSEQPDIVYSPFVEQGRAYKIEKMPAFSLALKIDTAVFDRLNAAFNRAIESLFHVGFQKPKPYHWQRLDAESVSQWGDRLFERGLLDDPGIRWEYQKAVFQAIGLKLTRLLRVRR